MTYLSLTDDEQHMHLARAIIGREHEIFSYQTNIDNHTHALQDLAQGPWPADIEMYKGWTHEQLAIIDEDKHTRIAEYMHRDRLMFLRRTEKIEMAKSQAVLNALLAKVPAGKLPGLIQQIKAATPG